jgi:hypothetical protein
MNINYRPYETEEDFWRMRAFLREVFVLNGYRERAWHVARLEYSRWYVCLNCHNVTLDQSLLFARSGLMMSHAAHILNLWLLCLPINVGG